MAQVEVPDDAGSRADCDESFPLPRDTPKGLMAGHGLLKLATMAGFGGDGSAGSRADSMMAAFCAMVKLTWQ